ARQRDPHGWLGRLRRSASQGLRSPSHRGQRQKGVGLGIDAAGAPGRGAAAALVAGNPPGSRQPGTPGLLPGRVYLPPQQAALEKSRKAFLLTRPTGRGGGTSALKSDGEMLCRGRRGKPQSVVATCVKWIPTIPKTAKHHCGHGANAPCSPPPSR